MESPDKQPRTAMKAGLVMCHDCSLLMDARETGTDAFICSRCNANVHFRKAQSIPATWALLTTACILFFPANLLPIMKVEFFGTIEYSTIMDGILYFFHEKEYGIGLIILVASVLVPLFKIIGLTIILLTIKFKWRHGLRHKTAMFRFIVFVGRWSMLDIFVIALMATLVNFGHFTNTVAAPAASYFAAVVVCTMLAAHTFDSRLLWDA